jgi:CubicO group peptidase (beta-lactamase class C family)
VLRGRCDRGLPRGDGRSRLGARRDGVRRPRRARGPRGLSRLPGLDRGALEAELEAADFSGVVHLVGDDDERPITIARGLADRAARIPSTVDTRFAVASISKLVTGATVARLVDAGVMAWSDRYVDLVESDWRPAALDPAVTIADLLGHTSGFGDYFDVEDPDADYGAIWTSHPPGTIRGPKDFWPLLRDLPQERPRGERAVYNNGAFVLIGIALEEQIGLVFPELVRLQVFEPLNMADSGFWPLDAVVERLAVGYLPPADDFPEDVGASWPESAWRTNVHAVPAMGGPDGGVQVTVGDLVRLIDGVSGRGAGAGLLAPGTRAELIGPHATDHGGDFRYGRGVIHVGEGPSARFGHTGEDPGASARIWTYPATGERVAVVSNVTDGAGAITRRIDELLVRAGEAR